MGQYNLRHIKNKNDDAFERYHCKTPYIEEFINVSGKSKSEDGNENTQVTTKILKYLSKKHKNAFVDVARAEGLSVSGVMDNVTAASMWSDAQVPMKQSLKTLQHLRVGLNAKISVPYSQVESLHAGLFTVLSLGLIQYQHKGGKYESIDYEYKSIVEEFELAVSELMSVNSVSTYDVEKIDFVIGGDHGIGAFHLIFRVIIKVRGRNDLIYINVACRKIICKKDTADILECTIMLQLTGDLQTLLKSSVVFWVSPDDNSSVTCELTTQSLTKFCNKE